MAIAEINTETAKGWPIPNNRNYGLVGNEDALTQLWQTKHQAKLRVGPNSTYNCHGLTFASRRTCIADAAAVAKILEDDCYREVQLGELEPGDTVIYFDEIDGSATHSGIVVEVSVTLPRKAMIVSKWGHHGEWLHWVDRSEYGVNYKFFRVDLEGERKVIEATVLASV